MPLAPTNVTEIPERSQGNDKLITENDITTANKDTFINRTAINTSIYTDTFGSLLSYTEGVPIIVEYFKKRNNYTNVQAIDTSFSGERSSIQFSYDLVHNFEIRLKDELDLNIDPEATEITLNGNAIIYPGFKPNVGDIFYLKLQDNRIGAFIVNLTQPVSIAHGTHYSIEFHFDAFVNETYDEKIRSCVSEELYFDKNKYFSDPATLLKSTSYNQLQLLNRYRSNIISNLLNTYYNSTEKTIICPDNIFDTYLIEYLFNKVSIKDNRKHICQIPNPDIDKYDNTILSVLLTQDISNLIYTSYTLCFYRQFLFDVNMSNIDIFRTVTPLLDLNVDLERYILTKFNTDDIAYKLVSYIFSNRFYYALFKVFETGIEATLDEDDLLLMVDDTRIHENLSDQFFSVNDNSYHDITYFDTHNKTTGSNNDMHLPELEYIFYNFIVNNTIDVDYLLDNVLKLFPFIKMTKLDKLYYSSMFIHLIDVTINRLR